jgi:AcrR family transcriptional regulator
MANRAQSPIFDVPLELPRGPHSLTREQVAVSQRTRLMAALTELLGERGYGGVTIGELSRRAGVSRAAFYEHFEDKEACLMAAYDRFAQAAVEALVDGIEQHTSWSAFIEAALAGYLGVLERDPIAARAFIVEMDGAPRSARARRRAAMHGFAAVLADRHAAIRAADPRLGPLPDSVYLALALGVREFVHDVLEREEPRPLTDFTAELHVLLWAVVEGAAATGWSAPPGAG